MRKKRSIYHPTATKKRRPKLFEKNQLKEKNAQKKQCRKKFAVRKHRQCPKSRLKRLMVEIGISFSVVAILLAGLSTFTFSFSKINGYSMIPTLNHGDWVFINKLGKPKRFKLVLYKDSTTKSTAVRRVIGLPGETIHYLKDKLYVNNVEVYERFLEKELQRVQIADATFTDDWRLDRRAIPKGKYVLLGDNRPYAADSREYGLIDEKEIIGVVEMRLLPFHQLKQF